MHDRWEASRTTAPCCATTPPPPTTACGRPSNRFTYARRLQATGVPCTLDVVDGAFHGFDAVFRTKPVTRRFLDEQVTALTAALFPTTPQRQASP